jgi:hypothetical protein
MEIIDELDIQSPKVEAVYRHGFSFHPTARIIGFLLTILGAIMIGTMTVLGLSIGFAIALTGLFLVTSASGFQVNFSKAVFREYTSFMGVKRGQWESLNYYPYLSVMLANRTLRASDITGVSSVTFTNESYGLYLLNKTHRKKVLVKRLTGRKESQQKEVAYLAEKFKKELVRYNPVRISRDPRR